MASFQWFVRLRNYEEEKNNDKLSVLSVQKHPLALLKNDPGCNSTQSFIKEHYTSVYCDPLLGYSLEGSDPLSQFSTDKHDEIVCKQGTQAKTIMKGEICQEWLRLRTSILIKFTTAEKLSITSSFLQGGEMLIVKQQIHNKVKHRLQQLDEFEENISEHKGLSQDDYIKIITQISEELQQAWALDQRVKALKIVIQCSKLLLETQPLAFYPSKFVLITDILDKFGRLVFQRIADRGNIKLANNELPQDFRPDCLSEEARETCRNWIYKIASVRELLPRIYVEMAILKCCTFLSSKELPEALIRLSRALRGVGNPLVATYARCYLSRIGSETLEHHSNFIEENITDFLFSYNQLTTNRIVMEIDNQKIDVEYYLSLYSPALNWMLQVLVRLNNSATLDSIWRHCLRFPNAGILWQSIMLNFPPHFVSSRALQLANLITTHDSFGVSTSHLLRLLGNTMSNYHASSPGDQAHIMNTLWPYLKKMEDVGEYLYSTEAWIPFVVQHFGRKEWNMVLNDIVAHTSSKVQIKHVPYLNNIVQAFISSDKIDFTALLTMDKWVILLDQYPDAHSKAEISKVVLQHFLRACSQTISNPTTVDNVIRIGRNFHDTLDALSVDDEKRQISELIIRFVDLVEFNRDLQQMLSFYGDVRAAFSSLDAVLAHLVQSVNRLSARTRQMITQHNKRTSNFVRACGAFAYITTPTIICPLTRFNLYLHSGQIALTNECFGQADACFEAAVSVITDIAPGDETWTISYVCNLLSTLLVHPDTAGQNRLRLLRRLLRAVRSYSSTHNLVLFRANIYVQALRLLSAFAQPNYIYHIPNVDSNDMLYIGDESFVNQIQENCDSILNELLSDINCLEVNKQFRQQSAVCLDLFSVLISNADLSRGNLSQLAANVFHLAKKYDQWDVNYAKRLSDIVNRRATLSNTFANLAASLPPFYSS